MMEMRRPRSVTSARRPLRRFLLVANPLWEVFAVKRHTSYKHRKKMRSIE